MGGTSHASPAVGAGCGRLPVRPGFDPAARAQENPLQAGTKTVNVELILDASGSMAEPLAGGETRMDAAKRILREVIDGSAGASTASTSGCASTATWATTPRPGKRSVAVASELLVPVAGLDKTALIAQVDAIQPTGWTPIAYSLQQAAADFQPGGRASPTPSCWSPMARRPAIRRSSRARRRGPCIRAMSPSSPMWSASPSPRSRPSWCAAWPSEGGGQLFGADDAQQLGDGAALGLGRVGVAPTPPAGPARSPFLADIHTPGLPPAHAWTTPVLTSGDQAPILSDDGQRIAFGTHPGTSTRPTRQSHLRHERRWHRGA